MGSTEGIIAPTAEAIRHAKAVLAAAAAAEAAASRPTQRDATEDNAVPAAAESAQQLAQQVAKLLESHQELQQQQASKQASPQHHSHQSTTDTQLLIMLLQQLQVQQQQLQQQAAEDQAAEQAAAALQQQQQQLLLSLSSQQPELALALGGQWPMLNTAGQASAQMAPQAVTVPASLPAGTAWITQDSGEIVGQAQLAQTQDGMLLTNDSNWGSVTGLDGNENYVWLLQQQQQQQQSAPQPVLTQAMLTTPLGATSVSAEASPPQQPQGVWQLTIPAQAGTALPQQLPGPAQRAAKLPPQRNSSFSSVRSRASSVVSSALSGGTTSTLAGPGSVSALHKSRLQPAGRTTMTRGVRKHLAALLDSFWGGFYDQHGSYLPSALHPNSPLQCKHIPGTRGQLCVTCGRQLFNAVQSCLVALEELDGASASLWDHAHSPDGSCEPLHGPHLCAHEALLLGVLLDDRTAVLRLCMPLCGVMATPDELHKAVPGSQQQNEQPQVMLKPRVLLAVRERLADSPFFSLFSETNRQPNPEGLLEALQQQQQQQAQSQGQGQGQTSLLPTSLMDDLNHFTSAEGQAPPDARTKKSSDSAVGGPTTLTDPPANDFFLLTKDDTPYPRSNSPTSALSAASGYPSSPSRSAEVPSWSMGDSGLVEASAVKVLELPASNSQDDNQNWSLLGSSSFLSFGMWCLSTLLYLCQVETRPELWGKYAYVLNKLQGFMRDSRLDSLLLASNLPSGGNGASAGLPPPGIPLSLDVMHLAQLREDVIKQLQVLEMSLADRKGPAGTAAGEVAFPKGKEIMQSIIKRFRRKLGVQTPPTPLLPPLQPVAPPRQAGIMQYPVLLQPQMIQPQMLQPQLLQAQVIQPQVVQSHMLQPQVLLMAPHQLQGQPVAIQQHWTQRPGEAAVAVAQQGGSRSAKMALSMILPTIIA